MGNAINMIFATCVLIMLVLLFRRLFWKKCNPNLLYFLWIFVALRILVPVNIPYILSMPASEQETVKTNISALVSGAVLTDASAPADGISDRDSESGVNLENPSEYGQKAPLSLKQILLFIWLCGCVLCAVYCLFINVCAFRNITKRQIGKVNKTVKVYEVEGYNCLVGVWNPHIFITPQVAENPVYRKYVLMHEMEHYKVKDNFWLLIRTICLSIQWFNPLVWIAYFKAQEDCELACDYRVLSHLKKEEKNAYADTLLYLLESNLKTAYLASSMGKAGYKKRLDSIYKKRNAKGFVFLCGVMCIATVLTFVQVTVSRAEVQDGSGMQNEKVLTDLENRADSDSAAREEENHIIYVESLDDLKRGENLDCENCYTTDIIRGNNHYWIDEEKVLWGVGASEYGQLKELKEDLGLIFDPVRISENVKHVDFSGEYFVIFITDDNKLYGLGGNAAGILQEADRKVRNSTYMNVVTEPVLLMENVVFAKCGYSSVIALTENGDVYVFGNNDYVPFSNESYYAPKKVMEHAKYVSAYYHTYAVIREDNSLWTWGYNNMGQCGNGAFSGPVATPQKVMEDVDCAWMGKVAFNSTGEMAEQDNLVIRKTDGGYYVCGAGTGADFRQAEIRQFVPLSLGNVELLWSEDELKQFLDGKQIDYYTSGRADNGYLVYMANGNEWEFVFNSAGELVSIASNQNDALEENLLRQGDAFDKVTEAYGDAYTRTDGEYNDFVVEYERENYNFRVYCYRDLGCAKFCKCIKGFDL